MGTTRTERAANLEKWVDNDSVDADELRSADTDALRQIVELVEQRQHVDQELDAAVHAARAAHRSWSEIGVMLGVSKQAAQRKYSNRTLA